MSGFYCMLRQRRRPLLIGILLSELRACVSGGRRIVALPDGFGGDAPGLLADDASLPLPHSSEQYGSRMASKQCDTAGVLTCRLFQP